MEKKRKKKSKFGYYLYAVVVLLLTLANITLAILLLTHVQRIQVNGTNISKEEDIKEWISKDPLTVNSLYTFFRYQFGDPELPVYLEDIKVSFKTPWELKVDVDEKDVMAYTKYKKSYIHFDEEGLVLRITSEQPKNIPFIESIPVRGANLFEPVVIKEEKVFSYVENMLKEVKKSGLEPTRYVWKNGSMNLYFDEVCVEMGKSNYGIKLAELPPILETLAGKKGVLRMEYFSQTGDSISFEEEK